MFYALINTINYIELQGFIELINKNIHPVQFHLKLITANKREENAYIFRQKFIKMKMLFQISLTHK